MRRRRRKNPSFWAFSGKDLAKGATLLIGVTIIRELVMRAFVNPYLNKVLPVETDYAPSPPVSEVVAAVEQAIGTPETMFMNTPVGENMAGLGALPPQMYAREAADCTARAGALVFPPCPYGVMCDSMPNGCNAGANSARYDHPQSTCVPYGVTPGSNYYPQQWQPNPAHQGRCEALGGTWVADSGCRAPTCPQPNMTWDGNCGDCRADLVITPVAGQVGGQTVPLQKRRVRRQLTAREIQYARQLRVQAPWLYSRWLYNAQYPLCAYCPPGYTPPQNCAHHWKQMANGGWVDMPGGTKCQMQAVNEVCASAAV